jgi:hypothetical protein
LGPSAKIKDFDENPDIKTGKYDLYEDNKQGPDVVQDLDDIPDDSYNNYIGAELTLQKGDDVEQLDSL